MNSRLPGIQSYWLMLIATVITVSIVTSSQLITQRISLLLDRQASELLAADLVLSSNQSFNSEYAQKAREMGLQVAHTASLRSAIFVDDRPQLIELKAVDAAYPLRGSLERARVQTDLKETQNTGPLPGEVWLDPALGDLLDSQMQLGSRSLAANWLLTYEPDRGGTLFNLAPRVLMNLDDLTTTGLVIAGSRVSYRLLFAGDAQQISQLRAWLTPILGADEKIQDLESARPEMRRALERTRKFFAFSIVLTLVIAMVAIAITARYTAAREAPKVAMLRAFGISQRQLMRFYGWQLARIWVIASLLGIALGWMSQYPLQWALDGWFGRELPQVYSPMPYLSAALIGFISLAGFSLPYLANVIATPPMQVFRALNTRRSLRRSLMVVGAAVLTIFVVLAILMQSSRLAVMTLGLVLIIALLLPAIFYFIINALLARSAKKFWISQYLLSRLKSSSRGALSVLSGFSLALLAILLIAVVKDELLLSWQTQLADDTPNYFLINLAAEEVPQIESFLKARGIPTSTAYPLVRARLTQINGTAIQDMHIDSERASHLVNHTYNLSYAAELPDDNKILTGKWLASDSNAEISVEQGMAESLGMKVGDSMTFMVGERELVVPVTSIRSVVWENFKPNFYLIVNRELLEGLPQTWLLSALVSDARKQELKPLLQQFPSVTLLDTTVLMSRIKGIISRATVALEFFFLFALASAAVVLLAAIQTGKHERQMESSLLRALSAHTGQLYRVHVLEFTLMGLLIGFFAAFFASLAGWVVSVLLFDIEYQFSLSIWLYSLISATLVLTIAGTLASRKVYNVSPMKMLRS